MSGGFLRVFIQVLWILIPGRSRYRHIITIEGGWLTFIVAFIQSALMLRTPRHVIIQFIMREKNRSLKSRTKYFFMRSCLFSVYLVICSSRSERQYYKAVFGWNDDKIYYIPFHTDPKFISYRPILEEEFIVSAGRTFRDYPTLVAAFSVSAFPLIIVASRSSINGAKVTPNIRVLYDIPPSELTSLMSRSIAVVLPLEDRMISVGQSVLLQAMALGKPVVATSVNGTKDYIEHMETGLLVPPNDPKAIADAVGLLIADKDLRTKLGRAAQERIKNMHLPSHYAQAVSLRLQQLESKRP